MKKMILFQVVILVFLATSWVKNIIKFSECDFESPFKCEIVHGVGLFPLFSMVTGWIDIEDGKTKL